jgi:hypothetical protein
MTEEGLGTLLLPLEAECVSHQGHYMVVEFADFKSASDAVQAWNGLFLSIYVPILIWGVGEV